MKDIKIRFILGSVIFLNLMSACQTEKIKEKTVITNQAPIQDTISEKQGEYPETWHRIELDKGYYVAFPKKPKKFRRRSRNRLEYTLDQENYVLYFSKTKLDKEPFLEKNELGRKSFYDAVIEDLRLYLANNSTSGELPELLYQESFLFLNIYEAIRVELQASDFQMEFKSVVIGNHLYTMSFIVWAEVNKEMLAIKKQFFQSFGKDLYIK